MRNCGSESRGEGRGGRDRGRWGRGREEVETGARREGEGDIARCRRERATKTRRRGARKRAREIGERGQEKINRPANMCQEEGKVGGKDGVERTHREARSHDLMNELAWLLAPWWGNTALTLLGRRLSSFARRLFRALRRETRAAENG